ncbi:fatty acid hydroxylase [Phellopilus nigrolimitatus]|nr:fatty acid hydroxylase [Phellopilus nigrolimitatus]KAH8118239.1 fatty acid hydroxylase [Phellopilus nigrolimitatus]
MDLVLSICDDLFLDRVWSTLVPLSAFADPSSSTPLYSFNSTSPFKASLTSSLSSSWSHIVSLSHLPHPQGLATNISQSFADVSHFSAWPRDYVPRQVLSLSVLTLVGIHLLYFIFAGLSYRYIFNHDMMRHPRFLKNQVRLEIESSLRAFPGMILLTLPWFQGEVMGYSKLYNDVNAYGWGYFFFSIIWFLLFTDYCIYWIHRWLHLPWLYKRLHKPHHKWIVPTPFSSHAFHPVDGYAQSVPYHLFVFIFPMQRHLYLFLFVAVNFWSIFIHDSDMITGHPLEKIINGPAHHTLHHLYFTVNYGQYFTWADRAGNSYRHPAKELDPMLEIQMAEAKAKAKDE